MSEDMEKRTATQQAKAPQKKKKSLLIAVIIVVILAAAAGGILMSKSSDKVSPQEAEEAYQKLQQAVIDGKVDPYANTVDFDKLWEINPDIYAWITIPGTPVDYPILTHEEDGHYLNITYDGKYGLPGSIFTDKYNSKEMTSPLTVIYGHKLSEEPDVMFGPLHKYADEEFMKENPYVYIYLPDKTLKYQIFSAVAFNDSYLLTAYDTATPDGFNQYIADLNSSMTGVTDEDLDVQFGKFVITMSTCITEYPEQRWLVSAVLIEQLDKE